MPRASHIATDHAAGLRQVATAGGRGPRPPGREFASPGSRRGATRAARATRRRARRRRESTSSARARRERRRSCRPQPTTPAVTTPTSIAPIDPTNARSAVDAVVAGEFRLGDDGPHRARDVFAGLRDEEHPCRLAVRCVESHGAHRRAPREGVRAEPHERRDASAHERPWRRPRPTRRRSPRDSATTAHASRHDGDHQEEPPEPTRGRPAPAASRPGPRRRRLASPEPRPRPRHPFRRAPPSAPNRARPWRARRRARCREASVPRAGASVTSRSRRSDRAITAARTSSSVDGTPIRC